MRKTTWAVMALLVILALILAACGGAAPGKSGAAAAVESYYKAMVAKDAAKMSAISCKDWESQALLEMDAFQAVKAELDGLTCKDSGTAGSATLVGCTGKINVTYNTEQQVIDLSRQVYKVVQEGGDYRVCGYQ
jgi:hypothetical protein